MKIETVEIIAGLIGGLAWPVALIAVVVVFRKQIGVLIQGIKELRVGGIQFELKRLNEKVSAVESATRNLSVDIYRVSGDALRVREEIWQYVAEILDKSSDPTKFEMRKALTERHLPHIGMTVAQAKEILCELGFLQRPDRQPEGFSEEITPELLQAVYDFQQAHEFEYADGIIGPKTSAQLKQQSHTHKTAQHDDPGDAAGPRA